MPKPLHLFEAFGVELEYMIVAGDTLDVRPICDELLRAPDGSYPGEVEHGPLSWSNELVLHVVELKTNGPAAALAGLPALFQQHVNEVQRRLAPRGAMLLPTAMHPWMDPHAETRLWPHEYNAVYEAFNRLFDCRGHGWSNLQSTHLNLPFCGDEEFGRLHAAIRVVLPLLPGLAASSPLADGRFNGWLDQRLEAYRHNADRVPQVAGRIIPEPAYTRAAYDRDIFQPLYAALRPHDPEGILQYEWANARGAIARFDRGAIEIRVLDIQECPAADLAVLALTIAVVRALAHEQFVTLPALEAVPSEPLERTLRAAIRDADAAPLDPVYGPLFGLPAGTATVGAAWRWLFERVVQPGERSAPLYRPLATIFSEGCLSRRILTATGETPDREHLRDVYRRLARCLATGEMFRPQHAAMSRTG